MSHIFQVKMSIACSLHFSTLGVQPTFHTQSTFYPPSAVCSLLSTVSVILFTLRPASLTKQNYQGHIIIQGLHSLGRHNQSIYEKIFFKNALFAQSPIKSNMSTHETFGMNRQNYL